MSAKRLHAVVSGIVGSTSRRAFLRYGGGMVGVSLLAPYWLRSAVAQSASTFDYYISSTGNDSNPGTLAAPWALTSLLNPALSASNPNNYAKLAGKRIGIMSGSYNVLQIAGGSYGSIAADFASCVLLIPNGTASSSTYVASCDSTTGLYSPRAAALNEAIASATATGPPLIGSSTNGQYITIDGLELLGSAGRLVSIGGGTAAGSPATSFGIVVQNCYLHGNLDDAGGANSTAITLYACNGALVYNNYITDIVNTTNRNSGIETWSSVGTQILNNSVVMSAAGSSGIYVKNAGQQNITVAYNYVDCSAAPSLGGSGACAWDLDGNTSNNSVFHHNIVLANAGFQDGIAGVSAPSISEQRQVYNNTFVGNSSQTFFTGFMQFSSGPTTRAYNNIYTSPSAAGGRGNVDLSATCAILTDYNLYPSPVSLGLTPAGSTAYPTLYTSVAAWAAALPSACIGKEAHTLVATPSFQGAVTGNLPAAAYMLTSGSPGSGSGSTNGQTSGSACDMGAWGNLPAGVAQIGCNFTPGSTTTAAPPVPMAPVLTVS